MIKRWKTLRSENVFKCPWFEILKDDVRLPNDKEIVHYKIMTRGSAVIVPVTDKGELVLTQQYRYPTDKISIEFPAGGLGNLNPDSAAKAELKEETGYTAERWQKVGQFVPWNGVGSEISHVYMAKNLTAGEQDLDESEIIELLYVSPGKFEKMIADNTITDGMTLSAWQQAKRFLKTDH